MSDDWTEIFVTDQLFRAELIKGILCDNGVEAVIMNHKDSSFQLGSIQVMVNQENQEKAIAIIKSINCE